MTIYPDRLLPRPDYSQIDLAIPPFGHRRPRSVAEAVRRFWNLVDITGDCWVWIGGRDRRGYGVYAPQGRSTFMRAPRYSMMITMLQPIPDGMWVLHHCDNRPCVRPDHLYLGTQVENVRDMVARGRSKSVRARGTSCIHGHEFTPENTYTYASVRRRFGVRQCRTCVLANGKKRRAAARMA